MLKSPVGVFAVIGGAISFGFPDQRGDSRTAREFLALGGSGQIAEARALLHLGTADSLSEDAMRAIFDPLAAFSEVSFTSVAWSMSNGVRQGRIEGTGTMADGCSSRLAFEMLNGAITHFSIAPLCQRQRRSV
ncbi:hypothetical protein [Roseicyclus elongatus]|uniref:hypothetical protein n=1 Tax=Roseicyclus elongatus TaxID=159346 RepID=UPI0012EB9B8E|nr:hypothetical protein [Roseibacterium elongatum]